jgi:nucleoside-diphosphate-sugar epimerase
MRVFVAGASGAIGRRLIPQLRAVGHEVVATTRTPGKVELLRGLGAEPVVVDGLDAAAVGEAVARAEPGAIVHQMTALADMSNLRNFDRTFAHTNTLRTTGLDHLLAAARATGVKRIVAQSYTGWTNPRTGTGLAAEADGLDPNPPRAQHETITAIAYLERAVTEAGGVALRYGSFYGPGASESMIELVRGRKLPIAGDGGGVWSWCHVDDAAAATVAALERGAGVYNIVDDEPAPVASWLPYFADAIGAKPPRRVPVWLARLAAGEVGVSMLTQIRGASNAKAKVELQWAPRWTTWRDGFRHGLTDKEISTTG